MFIFTTIKISLILLVVVHAVVTRKIQTYGHAVIDRPDMLVGNARKAWVDCSIQLHKGKLLQISMYLHQSVNQSYGIRLQLWEPGRRSEYQLVNEYQHVLPARSGVHVYKFPAPNQPLVTDYTCLGWTYEQRNGPIAYTSLDERNYQQNQLEFRHIEKNLFPEVNGTYQFDLAFPAIHSISADVEIFSDNSITGDVVFKDNVVEDVVNKGTTGDVVNEDVMNKGATGDVVVEEDATETIMETGVTAGNIGKGDVMPQQLPGMPNFPLFDNSYRKGDTENNVDKDIMVESTPLDTGTITEHGYVVTNTYEDIMTEDVTEIVQSTIVPQFRTSDMGNAGIVEDQLIKGAEKDISGENVDKGNVQEDVMTSVWPTTDGNMKEEDVMTSVQPTTDGNIKEEAVITSVRPATDGNIKEEDIMTSVRPATDGNIKNEAVMNGDDYDDNGVTENVVIEDIREDDDDDDDDATNDVTSGDMDGAKKKIGKHGSIMDLIDENGCETDSQNCAQICIKTIGSFMCACYEGYYLHANRKDCVDMDECTEWISPCFENERCINTNGSFHCIMVTNEVRASRHLAGASYHSMWWMWVSIGLAGAAIIIAGGFGVAFHRHRTQFSYYVRRLGRLKQEDEFYRQGNHQATSPSSNTSQGLGQGHCRGQGLDYPDLETGARDQCNPISQPRVGSLNNSVPSFRLNTSIPLFSTEDRSSKGSFTGNAKSKPTVPPPPPPIPPSLSTATFELTTSSAKNKPESLSAPTEPTSAKPAVKPTIKPTAEPSAEPTVKRQAPKPQAPPRSGPFYPSVVIYQCEPKKLVPRDFPRDG